MGYVSRCTIVMRSTGQGYSELHIRFQQSLLRNKHFQVLRFLLSRVSSFDWAAFDRPGAGTV